MKAIIAGGRKFIPLKPDYLWLDDMHKKLGITMVMSGCATGADQFGEAWAKLHGIPVDAHPAEWTNINAKGAVVKQRRNGSFYNALAGFWRNQAMADTADVLLVFPGGSGTADMIFRARLKGMPVYHAYERDPAVQ